jgi:hypothetical protein
MNIDEVKLSISERKILRKMYGPNFVNVVWRIKNNDAPYSLYKELSIMKTIKRARLKWLGHIARMEDYVSFMKTKFSQPEFRRKKGRPRLKWLDSVSKELNTLGVNTWGKKQEIRVCGV